MPTTQQPAEDSCRCRRRKWRRDGGEIAPAHGHHLVEIAAPGACLHVGAHLSPSQVAAIVRRQDTSNRVTRHVAALRHLVQSCTRLEHELLGRSGACLERRADLGVVEPAQLAHHECGALPVLKLLQVGDQLPQPLPCGGIRSPRGRDVHRLLEAGVSADGGAAAKWTRCERSGTATASTGSPAPLRVGLGAPPPSCSGVRRPHPRRCRGSPGSSGTGPDGGAGTGPRTPAGRPPPPCARAGRRRAGAAPPPGRDHATAAQLLRSSILISAMHRTRVSRIGKEPAYRRAPSSRG